MVASAPGEEVEGISQEAMVKASGDADRARGSLKAGTSRERGIAREIGERGRGEIRRRG